jgi:thioredoxin-related protein
MQRIFRGLLAAGSLTLAAGAVHAESALGYEPSDDPFALVAAAREQARADDKEVLVIAGGDWCIWCHYLDAFLKEHAELYDAFKDTFVVAKVYMGDENTNEAFFATLPEAVGYPHFWILSADGDVLESQNTLPLEDGDKSYDPTAFSTFIDAWR